MSVVIETTVGDLTVDLYLKERPKTCLNFLKLCKNKAYNCRWGNYIGQDLSPTFYSQLVPHCTTWLCGSDRRPNRQRKGWGIHFRPALWRTGIFQPWYYHLGHHFPILGEIFRKRGDPADQAHETWPRVDGQLRHCG